MNWALLGQGVTAWCIVAFFSAPLVGRYLRRRRANAELRARLGKAYIDRAAMTDAVMRELAEGRKRGALEPEYAYKQRLSREAVTPLTESQWQQNARIAEALGFDQDTDSKRAS